MDFGCGLAVVGAEDASGVLDELSLVGDGCGEEERVQRGTVEALAGRAALLDGLADAIKAVPASLNLSALGVSRRS